MTTAGKGRGDDVCRCLQTSAPLLSAALGLCPRRGGLRPYLPAMRATGMSNCCMCGAAPGVPECAALLPGIAFLTVQRCDCVCTVRACALAAASAVRGGRGQLRGRGKPSTIAPPLPRNPVSASSRFRALPTRLSWPCSGDHAAKPLNSNRDQITPVGANVKQA